jgi:hypothetical protein
MRRVRGRAADQLCARCAEDGTGKPARDWATVHGESGEDPWADYVPLCRACHIAYDGSGHRVPHTASSRAKMSEGQKRRFARDGGANKFNSGKTYCPEGHDYDEENTYRDKNGYRSCKTCSRARTRAWRAGRRGDTLA